MLSRNRTPPMPYHAMRERKPPERLGQEGEPIVVGDKVRVRDGKTNQYCPAVVISIEVDGMMVQWVGDNGPGAPRKGSGPSRNLRDTTGL